MPLHKSNTRIGFAQKSRLYKAVPGQMTNVVPDCGRGGGRNSHQGGHGAGCSGCGRGRNNARKMYATNVDITDPHRNFTSAE